MMPADDRAELVRVVSRAVAEHGDDKVRSAILDCYLRGGATGYVIDRDDQWVIHRARNWYANPQTVIDLAKRQAEDS